MPTPGEPIDPTFSTPRKVPGIPPLAIPQVADPFGDVAPTGGLPPDTYRLSDERFSHAAESQPLVTRIPSREDPELRTPRRARPAAGFWEMSSYNALIFITSVCVMTLELTASRLIGKHVGGSLYTWTSVIGVVLAGMTLGNWLGGYLADRYDRRKALSVTLLVASMTSALVLLLDQQLATWERPAGVSWPVWILIVVGVMFLAPALALGTTSPLLATLALSRSTRLGITVGNVHAWGAAGSIAGTFLTGFYLIDIWGTRTILCGIAITLALLAALVSSTSRVYRTATVLGWMQFLTTLTLLAAGTRSSFASVGDVIGTITSSLSDTERQSQARLQWSAYTGQLGDKLHELGLALQLRDDQVGEYDDESAYSFIHVGEDTQEGKPVKYLRLDKLVHSYFNPDDPTALVYEYEDIYAAVSVAQAQTQGSPVEVVVPAFPNEQLVWSKLPAGVVFEPASRTLKIAQPRASILAELTKLSASDEYWQAIELAYRESNKPGFPGFWASTLTSLPAGVTWPAEQGLPIHFDAGLHSLTVYGVISEELRDRLMALAPDHPWRTALNTLKERSAAASGLFLGGGGFIFPRWFVEQFPGTTRAHVAELDPAVYRVAVEQLGFTQRDAKRITTTFGDARNTVDDLLRENRQRVLRKDEPQLYDFIYGDAFNDFSIPWHLSTREFLAKQRQLLTGRGVLQANIIEIYPRTVYPLPVAQVAQVTFRGELPTKLLGLMLENGLWKPAGSAYPGIWLTKIAWNTYELRAQGPVPVAVAARLAAIDDRSGWKSVVQELAEQSREQPPYAGTVPEVLRVETAEEAAWTPAPTPYSMLELYKLPGNQYSLAVRGILTDTDQQRLLELAPADAVWREAIGSLYKSSQTPVSGRFLGRYVATGAAVFPHVYVYSAAGSSPNADRDTFVMVCSQQPIDRDAVIATGLWHGQPFAWLETAADGKVEYFGQMRSVLALSEGQLLTDDFAPVDNLLRPVFMQQE